jgi:hypothetical protein
MVEQRCTRIHLQVDQFAVNTKGDGDGAFKGFRCGITERTGRDDRGRVGYGPHRGGSHNDTGRTQPRKERPAADAAGISILLLFCHESLQ